MESLNIDPATAGDAQAISQLIISLAPHFLQDPQGTGAEAFLQTLTPAAIRKLIEAPNMRYCKAVMHGRLAGVVALRDNAHLFHLFVDPAFQGRGLGRRLWLRVQERAVANGNASGFTVNSTPYAVPVYARFGFTATGPRADKSGISFIPRCLVLNAEGPPSANT